MSGYICTKLSFALDASICEAKELRCILLFFGLDCEASGVLAAYKLLA